MKETKKQLHDLIRTFYGESEVRQIVGEIEQADRMIAAFDSPQPRTELTEQIKQQMMRQTAMRHRRTTALRSVLSAAAACLLIGAGLVLLLNRDFSPLPPSQPVTIGPGVIEEFFSDEAITEMASNLDEISDQIYAVHTSEWDSDWEVEAIAEIEEMDRLANSDFWKG